MAHESAPTKALAHDLAHDLLGDVHPGIVLARPGNELLGRVKRTGVHVTRLHAKHRRACDVGQTVSAHTSLRINRDPEHPLASQAEHGEHLVDGGVRLLPK